MICRDQKTKENRAYKKQVQNVTGKVEESKKKKRQKSFDETIVTRQYVEEVKAKQMSRSFNFVDKFYKTCKKGQFFGILNTFINET